MTDERDLLLRDQPAGVKHFRRRALAAEARVEALSEALREIAEFKVVTERWEPSGIEVRLASGGGSRDAPCRSCCSRLSTTAKEATHG